MREKNYFDVSSETIKKWCLKFNDVKTSNTKELASLFVKNKELIKSLLEGFYKQEFENVNPKSLISSFFLLKELRRIMWKKYYTRKKEEKILEEDLKER